MENLKNYFMLMALAVLTAACSTNQDLVMLEEYDDIYYTGSDRTLTADLDNNAAPASLDSRASSAESSYYSGKQYEDQQYSSNQKRNEEPKNVEPEYDYYEEDYGRRIENFHRSEEPNYMYGNQAMNNNSPNFFWNVGFNSFGPRSMWNMGFGNGFNSFPGYGGGFYGNPGWNMGWGMGMAYRSPWCSTWDMYDPFSPCYRPWGNPYGFYNPYNPYAFNPFWNPGWYYPYSPPIFPGGGWAGNNDGYSNRIVNTPRNGSSTTRPSRGGVISQGTNTGGSRADDNKSNADNEIGKTRSERSVQDSRVRTESREVENTTRDYYNRNDAREYTRTPDTRTVSPERGDTRTRETRRDYTPRTAPTRNTVSPYTREMQQPTRSSTSPTRSRSNSNWSNPSPSRSSSPSYSPSPSRSGGGSSPSPSRSSSPRRR